MPSQAQVPAVAAQDVAALLTPSYAARVAQQFFTHSAHAPLTILILEWLLSRGGYFGEPDAYVLICAALAQALWLAHPNASRTRWVVLGNLLGALVYSLAESLLEGMTFFMQPQHIAYWAIAVTFAVLEGVRHHWRAHAGLNHALLLLVNIARAAIPVLLYAVFEARSKHAPMDLVQFFADSAHIYLTIVVLLLGILLGFADLTLQRTQQALRVLAERLHQLSSWGFGAQVVAAALADAEQVALKRQERAMLFMDIRGFTAWSENQAPEAVVSMLNAYYAASEVTLQPLAPIKVKFTADEVMAVFADKSQAFVAARQLQKAVAQVLGAYQLAAGLGLHAGPVVEGLLGSLSVKAYEVIGDAVNTASRLCSAAGAGELLVSQTALPGIQLEQFPLRQVEAKGKREPLAVRVLALNHAPAAG
jgi:class 3 adenylate cyclase